MHDIVNHRAPEYLYDLFNKCLELNPHKPNTRESETSLIIPRIPRTEHYKDIFRTGVLNYVILFLMISKHLTQKPSSKES